MLRSEKVDAAIPVKLYPRTMASINNGSIILFEREKEGMCIHAEYPNYVGEYSKDWVMEYFKPFTGTIKIESL